MDYTWEVYNPVMGFKTFESECPIAAVEMAAEYFDSQNDLSIVRGAATTFGVRKLRSRKPFTFYRTEGRAILIYDLHAINEQTLDDLFVAAFEHDYLKYVKKRQLPAAHPIWSKYNEV